MKLTKFLRRLVGTLPTEGTPTSAKSGSYNPISRMWFNQPRDLPAFSFATIYAMLIDPQVRLCLAMREAPMHDVELAYQNGVDEGGKPRWVPGVQARNPAVAAWVERQVKTIWRMYLPDILSAQKWGWSGGEITLRLSEHKLIEIDRLLPRHASDIILLKRDGERSGIRIKRVAKSGSVDLDFPKCWFHSFSPEAGEDYGNPILLGAYGPWSDKWFNGGALDTRRLFMHKDAYGGMKIGYPEDFVTVGDQSVPARDIALQIAEQRENGGTITYPSTCDPASQKPKWVIEEATVSNNPQHILQYPKDLDDEIRIGMEIPDDVISNDGTGAWAGKRVPLQAFYSGLNTWVSRIFTDLRQSLEPLVLLNWGKAYDFDLCHKPLGEMAMEQQGGAAPGAQQAAPSYGPGAVRMSTIPVNVLSRHIIRLSTGPKDGDRKTGKQGDTLEFYRGRWHLIDNETGKRLARKLSGTHNSVESLVDDVVSNPISSQQSPGTRWIDYGNVSDAEADKIQNATGLDVSNYVRQMQDDVITHALSRHSAEVAIASEIPITIDDIKRVPFYIQNSTSIRLLGKTKSGNLDAIEYRYQENGHVVVVEEVRTDREKLSFRTIFKLPGKKKP